MQASPRSLSSGEESATLHTLASSLHTLSLASLRELLLSCALENEQVASYMQAKLHSQNGASTDACNLENFKFHSSGCSGEFFEGEGPINPDPDYSNVSNNNNNNNNNSNNIDNYKSFNLNSSVGSTITLSKDLRSSGGIERPKIPLSSPSWNWSYYYYKESSTGGTAKRDDIDEAAAEVQSRAYYWNDEFQAISEKIRDKDLYDEEHAFISMANLYHDFEHVVETYGKIIIAERFLPFAQKSIPPAFYMGGHAGGEKYIVQGILFKFSVDKNNLYNGDHYAAKAAGHDLKSLIQVYKSRTEGLHVPMMCLVDYLGYRLTAMPMLPVDLSTLCYGSCDGGNEVRNDIIEFNDKMLQLGNKLNLKVHAVGAAGKEIVGPCDIEGHNGRDGRFYLIDFARLYPPEAPLLLSANRKNAHLYRLLRPELVKSFSVPLSSDAFTLFGKRGAGVHNKEVRQATEHLLQVVIPKFAAILDFQEQPDGLSKHINKYSIRITDDRIAEILHREGINLRHLGRVRAKVHTKRWRDSLLREIICRVIKNTIRDKLRAQMEQLKIPGLVLYRQTIVDYLNLVFGNSTESLTYWATELAEKIEYLYEDAMVHENAENCSNLKENVDLHALFTSVRKMTGMVFSPHCITSDPTLFHGPIPLQETDLLFFQPKIKKMRIAAYATATSLYLKAKYNNDISEAERLASTADLQFQSALRSNPDDDMILCSYALLLRFQRRFEEANAYYKMAIRSNRANARIMGHYAWFLFRDLEQHDKADKYYLKTLEVAPDHARTLADYATFLVDVRKDFEKAETYYQKGVALGDKQCISGYATLLSRVGRDEEAKIYFERLKSASGALILTPVLHKRVVNS